MRHVARAAAAAAKASSNWALHAVDSNTHVWNDVAISQNGAIIVAADGSQNGGPGGYLWISTARDVWTAASDPGLKSWQSVDISSNGNIIIAGFAGDGTTAGSAGLAVSTDRGANWSAPIPSFDATNGLKSGIAVAVSGSGVKMAVADAGFPEVFLSTDSGATFPTITPPSDTVPVTALAVSRDGSTIMTSWGVDVVAFAGSTGFGALSSAGSVLFLNTADFTGSGYVLSLATTAGQSVIVGGSLDGTTFVIKSYSSSGALQWTYALDLTATLLGISCDGDGKTAFTYTLDAGDVTFGPWIAKLDAAGSLLWAVNVQAQVVDPNGGVGTTYAMGNDVYPTCDGAGNSFVSYEVSFQYLTEEANGAAIAKLDPSGAFTEIFRRLTGESDPAGTYYAYDQYAIVATQSGDLAGFEFLQANPPDSPALAQTNFVRFSERGGVISRQSLGLTSSHPVVGGDADDGGNFVALYAESGASAPTAITVFPSGPTAPPLPSGFPISCQFKEALVANGNEVSSYDASGHLLWTSAIGSSYPLSLSPRRNAKA